MCRHLAYLGPARSLASLLYESPHSLERQSWRPRHQREGALNADGWGVGWWDRDVRPEPAQYRTAAPMWTDRSFHSVAEVVRAPAVVAATRSATPPSPIVTTGNAPFSSGPWLFSLNGYITGFVGQLGEELRRAVSVDRAAGIQGSTDSEVLFAHVLDRLDAGQAPGDALDDVTTYVHERAEARLNLVLGDGEQIFATACGNSLFTLLDAGLAAGGVLVSSEPLDGHPAWEPVPPGSLVTARPGDVQIRPLTTTGDHA
jgi:glutamine amidotransferase